MPPYFTWLQEDLVDALAKLQATVGLDDEEKRIMKKVRVSQPAIQSSSTVSTATTALDSSRAEPTSTANTKHNPYVLVPHQSQYCPKSLLAPPTPCYRTLTPYKQRTSAKPHFTAPPVTAPHLTAPHRTSPHVTARHHTSPHATSRLLCLCLWPATEAGSTLQSLPSS